MQTVLWFFFGFSMMAERSVVATAHDHLILILSAHIADYQAGDTDDFEEVELIMCCLPL